MISKVVNGELKVCGSQFMSVRDRFPVLAFLLNCSSGLLDEKSHSCMEGGRILYLSTE
ncbi:hypothetical protein ACS0TY_000333 [Phlomoides rotata]